MHHLKSSRAPGTPKTCNIQELCIQKRKKKRKAYQTENCSRVPYVLMFIQDFAIKSAVAGERMLQMYGSMDQGLLVDVDI